MSHDHPELLAFLRAIADSPDDDTPRLVAADWLEEHDESERAEFIRCQIDLATKELPVVHSHSHAGMRAKAGERVDFFCRRSDIDHVAAGQQVRVKCVSWDVFGFIEVISGYDQTNSGCVITLRLWPEPEGLTELRRREKELLRLCGEDMARPIAAAVGIPESAKFAEDGVGWACLTYPLGEPDALKIDLDWRRGFLSKLSLSWRDWSRHSDSILASPWVPGLDEVELTTMPEAGGGPDERLRNRFLEIRWPKSLVRKFTLPPEPRAETWTN